MIEEFGTIVELRDGRVAVVQCVKHSACQHCPSSGSCQLGSDSESMLVEAFNQAGARLNDYVKVVTTTKNFLQSSFLLYIVPIIALLAGALLGQALGEMSGDAIDPSLAAALMGTLWLVVCFLLIRYFTRSLKREKYMPTIVAVEYSAERQNDTV